MNLQLSCLALVAVVQAVLSAPASYDFDTFFKNPPKVPNFRPWTAHPVNERSLALNKHMQSDFVNKPWQPFGKASQHQQISSRSSSYNSFPSSSVNTNSNVGAKQHSFDSISSDSKIAGRTMLNDDSIPQYVATMIGARQSLPVISVPPLLPPIPGITEQMLYGSVNIDALTAPYSLGDNTTENQTPVQLPATSQVLNGTVNVYDHGFEVSTKVQDVISNHEINTFTNQTNRVTVNNLDLHRFYKLVNATTNYITNVQRVNQSAIFNDITNNNATEYQPYLYIVQSQTNVVNDNQTAVQLPVIESSSISSVTLPPVFDTPVVVKYDYNGVPVPMNGTTGGSV